MGNLLHPCIWGDNHFSAGKKIWGKGEESQILLVKEQEGNQVLVISWLMHF
jgi:hypothetical protein